MDFPSQPELGRVLRERRADRGVTQARAAAGVAVNRVTWARWELGVHEPRLVYRRALERFLRGEGK